MLQMVMPTPSCAVTPTERSMSFDSSTSVSHLLPEEGVITVEGLRHCDVALNPKYVPIMKFWQLTRPVVDS
jgi:hypothetical protein